MVKDSLIKIRSEVTLEKKKKKKPHSFEQDEFEMLYDMSIKSCFTGNRLSRSSTQEH